MSYLENRKQFVQCKNCESDMLNVCCGVPQGYLSSYQLKEYNSGILLRVHKFFVGLFIFKKNYQAKICNSYASDIHGENITGIIK